MHVEVFYDDSDEEVESEERTEDDKEDEIKIHHNTMLSLWLLPYLKSVTNQVRLIYMASCTIVRHVQYTTECTVWSEMQHSSEKYGEYCVVLVHKWHCLKHSCCLPLKFNNKY